MFYSSALETDLYWATKSVARYVSFQSALCGLLIEFQAFPIRLDPEVNNNISVRREKDARS